MPMFEYVCKDCQNKFEVLVRNGRTPTCPSCEGQSLDKALSVFATKSTANAHIDQMREAVASGAGPCGSCPNAAGPGACGMN